MGNDGLGDAIVAPAFVDFDFVRLGDGKKLFLRLRELHLGGFRLCGRRFDGGRSFGDLLEKTVATRLGGEGLGKINHNARSELIAPIAQKAGRPGGILADVTEFHGCHRT